MIKKILTLIAAATLLCSMANSFAAATNTPASDLKDLVGKIRTRLQEGKPTEQSLAPELKQFDALLAKYKNQKSDDVANILLMKATLYGEVLENQKKQDEIFAQLKKDFPDSTVVKRLKQQEEAEKLQAQFKPGVMFPDFNQKDLEGKPLSIAHYKGKGKVVLLDFWATWCGPCVAELPNVLETYKKHHGQGFEVIGISLDQDREKLTSFIRQKGMEWPQFFDGKGWENELAQKYGIRSIPATFLLDGDGKIIARDLRGERLETAVAQALKK